MSRVFDELKEYLTEGLNKHEIDTQIVFGLIDEFSDIESKKFAEMRKDKKLTFGRYRGYTVKELALTDKGKEYCSWLMGQTWFRERNGHLVDEIRALNIKPVKYKRTQLE